MKIYTITQIQEFLQNGKLIYDGESFEILDDSINKNDLFESLIIILKSVDK